MFVSVCTILGNGIACLVSTRLMKMGRKICGLAWNREMQKCRQWLLFNWSLARINFYRPHGEQFPLRVDTFDQDYIMGRVRLHWYVCLSVGMYVCVWVCVCVCKCVSMPYAMYVCMGVCMYVLCCVRVYVCVYVCTMLHACVCMHECLKISRFAAEMLLLLCLSMVCINKFPSFLELVTRNWVILSIMRDGANYWATL